MRILALLIPSLLAAGCSQAKGGATPDESTARRSFALSGFDRVALRGSDDIRVINGPAFAISATGPQAVLDQLELSVEGNTLTVSRKEKTGWNVGWSNGNVRNALVTVTMPAISGASIAGSGDINVDSATGPEFVADVAGSGDLSLAAAKVASLSADIAGSGSVTLAGSANSLDISIAGSGDVAAQALASSTAKISIAGSGNVDVRATGSASVSLMGSGDVNIVGTNRCTISKQGSGKVTCTP